MLSILGYGVLSVEKRMYPENYLEISHLAFVNIGNAYTNWYYRKIKEIKAILEITNVQMRPIVIINYQIPDDNNSWKQIVIHGVGKFFSSDNFYTQLCTIKNPNELPISQAEQALLMYLYNQIIPRHSNRLYCDFNRPIVINYGWVGYVEEICLRVVQLYTPVTTVLNCGGLKLSDSSITSLERIIGEYKQFANTSLDRE